MVTPSSLARRLVAATLAALVAMAVVLPGITVPLHNVAEPLEGLVVQEMARSGDWVLPRRNGEEIPAKPPLYHWLTLAAAEMRGDIDEVTIRIVSVVAAGLAVGVTFFATERVFGPVAAVAAAVAVATSPEWVKWAGYARTDALFAALLTVALFLGEVWVSERRRGMLLAAAVALGGAALAKGPTALVIAGGVVALVLVVRGEWRRLLSVEVVAAGLLALALAGSWYAAAIARGGEGFVEKQILAENLFRFLPVDDGGPSRDHGLFFYFPALLGAMFPWALALPLALRDGWREGGRRGDLARFAVVWVGVVFVLCSLADGKRSNYVLPLFPAAALLIGVTVSRALERAHETRSRMPALVGALVALPLAGIGLALLAWSLGFEPWKPILPYLHSRDQVNVPATAAVIGEPPLAFGIVAVALSVAILWTLRTRRLFALASLVGGTALLLAALGTGVLRPAEASIKTFRGFAARVAGRLENDPEMRFHARPDYGLLFYLGRHVRVEEEVEHAFDEGAWTLVWEEDLPGLPESVREALEIVERSPPGAVHRPRSRLFLVRLVDAS